MLKLYNTLGRELQDFKPITPGKVGFYGCGLTVYNYAHIGNLRAYVTHDILTRTLRRMGYDVTHVMNITDVGHLSDDADSGDDKMVRSAEERGKSVLEIAEFYTQAFYSDMEKLNIAKPAIICKATEHVPQMIELIKRIEANGFTYSAGGNLYFDISKFPHYGDLAMLHMDELKAGARIAKDANKRNPADFVLWFTKSKFENQALVWDSPWGRGYPGWHIECSAMSMKYLGEHFDIHAGGVDHIPIHHTNEIAQSEAATGRHPWVNYWLHNEFLIMEKGKMSKSAGDFITLKDLIDRGFDPMDYRYFLLGGHYRSQLQFSWAAMEGARNARKSLTEKIAAMAQKVPDFLEDRKPPLVFESTENYLEAFNRAMEEDLSTPRALAELWGLLRENSSVPGDTTVSESKITGILTAVLDMDRVLGLNLEKILKKSEKQEDKALSAEVEALVLERTEAKKAKNYAKADEIRNKLNKMGIILTDSPAGTTWKLNG
ncbi:MAG: cysteine--tRNA ligase [Treponema sp.]|nr:cysteine--tRNA ligase [Treponema sp.]